jgi:hypothetical protein
MKTPIGKTDVVKLNKEIRYRGVDLYAISIVRQ